MIEANELAFSFLSTGTLVGSGSAEKLIELLPGSLLTGLLTGSGSSYDKLNELLPPGGA